MIEWLGEHNPPLITPGGGYSEWLGFRLWRETQAQRMRPGRAKDAREAGKNRRIL